MVRDQDETETFDFQSEMRSRPRPSDGSTRPRCLETTSRDRDVETETTSLPNALDAVGKGMQTVKLCSNKILQFLTGGVRQRKLSCIIAVKW